MIKELRPSGLLMAVAIFVLCLCPPVRAEKLLPADDATIEPSLIVFRDNLLRAVERRDTDFVVAQASPDIHLSFGGRFGRETFRELLTGDQAWQGESYWRELEQVLSLSLGENSRRAGTYCAPYISCVIVAGCAICDSFENVYVLTADAPVYAAPDPSAPVVARLSYDILRLTWTPEPVGGSWVAVELPAGGVAYVDLDRPEYRVPEDYRAFFEKTDGRWQMTTFIAGD